MMKLKSLLLIINAILFSVILSAQPVLAPLKSYPIHEEKKPKGIQFRNNLTLPFIDDFSYDGPSPDTVKWENGGAYINKHLAFHPPSIGVATFDGIDITGSPYYNGPGASDTLTSAGIDLSGYDSTSFVALKFWVQPGGLGFAPEHPDHEFRCEFQDENEEWNIVWFSEEELSTDSFHFVAFYLKEPAFFHEKFRFRFINFSSNEGLLNLWHLDYVILEEDFVLDRVIPDMAFTEKPSFALSPYSAMPYRQFKNNEDKYFADSVEIHIYNHFNDIQLADSSSLTIRELETGTSVLPFETLLELPPLVDQNQRDLPPGRHIFTNEIKNRETAVMNLENLPESNQYLLRTTYSFRQAAEFRPEYRLNNTVTRLTVIDNYFAYDDGSPEVGLYLRTGQQGDPRMAVKYHLEVEDTLKAIRLSLPHIFAGEEDQIIKLMVWQGDLSGDPHYVRESISPLYPDNYSDTLNGFTTYTIKDKEGVDSFLLLPPGDFYIAWEQVTPASTEGLYIGYDLNTPDAIDHAFFYNGSTWQPLGDYSIDHGAIMIRPVMGGKTVRMTPVTSLPPLSVELYPNPVPAGTTLHLKIKEALHSAKLISMNGRVITLSIKDNKVLIPNGLRGSYVLIVNNRRTDKLIEIL